MIVARYNFAEGLTLDQMRSYHSWDSWYGELIRELPGLVTTQDAAYLQQVIVGSTFLREGGFHAKTKLLGEVLLLDAEDTGSRCMDRQLVVIPYEILYRMPVTDFINERYVHGKSVRMDGPKYDFIDRSLDYENASKWKLARECALRLKKSICLRWMDKLGWVKKC